MCSNKEAHCCTRTATRCCHCLNSLALGPLWQHAACGESPLCVCQRKLHAVDEQRTTLSHGNCYLFGGGGMRRTHGKARSTQHDTACDTTQGQQPLGVQSAKGTASTVTRLTLTCLSLPLVSQPHAYTQSHSFPHLRKHTTQHHTHLHVLCPNLSCQQLLPRETLELIQLSVKVCW